MKLLFFKCDRGQTAAHGQYYPHIDGIRALAVLPVLFFHIWAASCPGGFTGVDVFFVISGYLITGGILRDLQKRRFSIRNFYYRRIRRIMPAYFVMIICVFTAGCLFYHAAPLMLLGNAVAAGSLFMANIHFHNMGGDYFSPELHNQALLHLWSLSVEEQFYLIIPLLCAALWKLRRWLVPSGFALLAALSLCFAVLAVYSGRQHSAFYLLQFRAWELLAGSLLAMLPSAVCKDNGLRREKWPALLAAVGLLMIIATYILISSKTPFPGVAAISPVIGAALLIRYGEKGPVSRILCCKPAVFIGKISYSLYLWHWPVSVFWRYAVYDELYAYDRMGMFALSLLFGYLSWRFVETPVRVSAFWTVRRAFAFAAGGIVALVCLGTACVYGAGWPVLHPKANRIISYTESGDPFITAKFFSAVRRIGSLTGCKSAFLEKHEHDLKARRALFLGQEGNKSKKIGADKDPRIFILGDSHAGNLLHGMDVILQKEQISGYITSLGGIELFDVKNSQTDSALEKLESFPGVTTVILAQMWSAYSKKEAGVSEEEKGMYDRIETFAARIRAMGKTLVILTDTPCYRHSPNDIMARAAIIAPRNKDIVLEHFSQPEEEYSREQGRINQSLKAVCDRTDAILLPLHEAFKQSKAYIAFAGSESSPVPLYSDNSHLSHEGSLMAASFMMSSAPLGVVHKSGL